MSRGFVADVKEIITRDNPKKLVSGKLIKAREPVAMRFSF